VVAQKDSCATLLKYRRRLWLPVACFMLLFSSLISLQLCARYIREIMYQWKRLGVLRLVFIL
jgi:hypothetical protein